MAQLSSVTMVGGPHEIPSHGAPSVPHPLQRRAVSRRREIRLSGTHLDRSDVTGGTPSVVLGRAL